MGWFDNYIVRFVFTDWARRRYGSSSCYVADGNPYGYDMIGTFRWTTDIGDAMSFSSKDDAKYFVKQLVKAYRANGMDLYDIVDTVDYIPVKE